MKAKHAVSLLLFGYCIDFIGGLFKVLHTSSADLTLTLAAIFKVLGGLILIHKILTYPKFKDFMDR
jgi:hypothetical protein